MPIYASAVLKGIVDYVSKYAGVSFDVVLIVIGVLAAVFVIMGGSRAYMYADAFNGTLMFAGMAFLIIYTYSILGGITNAHSSLPSFLQCGCGRADGKTRERRFCRMDLHAKSGSPLWWNIVTTLIAGVGIGVLAQPQLSVKFMTVKSGRELNRAVLSGGIFILFMTGVAFTVGALSNVAFYNETGQIAIAAAGSNDGIIPHI
jgi:SSS family solute:Na+ symporter